jgi:hypothetical protein
MVERKRLGGDKRSSLFWTSIGDEEKSFIMLKPVQQSFRKRGLRHLEKSKQKLQNYKNL